MAFKQADGKVAWAKNDFRNAYSSPLLIDVGGMQQLAALMDGAVCAVDPNNGDCSGRCHSTPRTRSPSRHPYGGPAICCSSPPSMAAGRRS